MPLQNGFDNGSHPSNSLTLLPNGHSLETCLSFRIGGRMRK